MSGYLFIRLFTFLSVVSLVFPLTSQARRRPVRYQTRPVVDYPEICRNYVEELGFNFDEYSRYINSEYRPGPRVRQPAPGSVTARRNRTRPGTQPSQPDNTEVDEEKIQAMIRALRICVKGVEAGKKMAEEYASTLGRFLSFMDGYNEGLHYNYTRFSNDLNSRQNGVAAGQTDSYYLSKIYQDKPSYKGDGKRSGADLGEKAAINIYENHVPKGGSVTEHPKKPNPYLESGYVGPSNGYFKHFGEPPKPEVLLGTEIANTEISFFNVTSSYYCPVDKFKSSYFWKTAYEQRIESMYNNSDEAFSCWTEHHRPRLRNYNRDIFYGPRSWHSRGIFERAFKSAYRKQAHREFERGYQLDNYFAHRQGKREGLEAGVQLGQLVSFNYGVQEGFNQKYKTEMENSYQEGYKKAYQTAYDSTFDSYRNHAQVTVTLDSITSENRETFLIRDEKITPYVYIENLGGKETTVTSKFSGPLRGAKDISRKIPAYTRVKFVLPGQYTVSNMEYDGNYNFHLISSWNSDTSKSSDSTLKKNIRWRLQVGEPKIEVSSITGSVEFILPVENIATNSKTPHGIVFRAGIQGDKSLDIEPQEQRIETLEPLQKNVLRIKIDQLDSVSLISNSIRRVLDPNDEFNTNDEEEAKKIGEFLLRNRENIANSIKDEVKSVKKITGVDLKKDVNGKKVDLKDILPLLTIRYRNTVLSNIIDPEMLYGMYSIISTDNVRNIADVKATIIKVDEVQEELAQLFDLSLKSQNPRLTETYYNLVLSLHDVQTSMNGHKSGPWKNGNIWKKENWHQSIVGQMAKILTEKSNQISRAEKEWYHAVAFEIYQRRKDYLSGFGGGDSQDDLIDTLKLFSMENDKTPKKPSRANSFFYQSVKGQAAQ